MPKGQKKTKKVKQPEEVTKSIVEELDVEEVKVLTVDDLLGKKYHQAVITGASQREDGTVELTLDDGTSTIVPSLDSV